MIIKSGKGAIVFAFILLLAGIANQLGATPPEPKEEADSNNSMTSSEPIIVDDLYEVHTVSHTTKVEGYSFTSSMSEDFESSWPKAGWELFDGSSSDGGNYLWGRRNCNPHTGGFAGWSVGGGAQGNNLNCGAEYPNNARSWAVYGPFDLSNKTSVKLSFHLRGYTAAASGCPWDYLYVGGSNDGENFSGSRYCGNWTDGDRGNGYHQREFDLSSYLGQSQVWVAFLFLSNSSVTNIGFTIDDITLDATGNETPTPAPTTESLVFLPGVMNSSTQPTITPSPTPPPAGNIPCLLVLAQKNSTYGGFEIQAYCINGSAIDVHWRYDPVTGAQNGFDLIIKDSQGSTVILYQASIDINRDQFGRIGSYSGIVSGVGFPSFTETIVNEYNQVGKMVGASVTKVYSGSGESYAMDLTPCSLGDSWSGYRVAVFGGAYNGELFVRGTCS